MTGRNLTRSYDPQAQTKKRVVVTLWAFVGLLVALTLLVGCLLWLRSRFLA